MSIKNMVKSMAAKIPTSRVSVAEKSIANLSHDHPVEATDYGKTSQKRKHVSDLNDDIHIIDCDENIDTVCDNISLAGNSSYDFCDQSDTFDTESDTSVVSASGTVRADVHNSGM